MKALVFDASGREYFGTELNVRAGHLHGQPCPTDPPTYEYTYLGPIFGLDYWACHRFDSDHPLVGGRREELRARRACYGGPFSRAASLPGAR